MQASSPEPLAKNHPPHLTSHRFRDTWLARAESKCTYTTRHSSEDTGEMSGSSFVSNNAGVEVEELVEVEY